MIVIFASVRARPGLAEELAEELAATADTRSTEPGNIAFIVARDQDDPDEFKICEIYADAAAHAEHRRLARRPDDPHAARLAQLVAHPAVVSIGTLVSGPDGVRPLAVEIISETAVP